MRRMIKGILTAGTVVALAALLWGCGRREPDRGPTLTVDAVELEQDWVKPCTALLPEAETALVRIAESPAGVCWEAEDGSCYCVATVSGPDPEAALRELTGFSPEQLHPLRQRRFGMAEYRFSWVTATDEGTFLCTGQLHQDEAWCYGLAVCCREDAAPAIRALCSTVYANYGLYYDEGA